MLHNKGTYSYTTYLLQVYDGFSDSQDFPKLGRSYCGNNVPPRLTSTGNTVFMKFHTESAANGHTGFNGTFTANAPGFVVFS